MSVKELEIAMVLSGLRCFSCYLQCVAADMYMKLSEA